MAKELPYFKFEPAEYLTKDVSFCSLAAQGLFTNICAYYWQRKCKLTKKQLIRRLNYEVELNELINEGVVDFNGEDIIIKFLDAQLLETITNSKIGRVNGLKGGAPKGNNNAKKQPKNNVETTQKQTIRQDKIREDKIKDTKVSIYKEKEFLEDWTKCRKAYLKLPTHISKLEIFEALNFSKATNIFTREQIQSAMKGLFMQEVISFSSMITKPNHFLERVEQYYMAYESKDFKQYGSKKAQE